MTISIVRPYTAEDRERVRVCAEQFCDRHSIAFDASDSIHGVASGAELAIEYWIFNSHEEDVKQHNEWWMKDLCQALCVPFDIRIRTMGDYIGIKVGH